MKTQSPAPSAIAGCFLILFAIVVLAPGCRSPDPNVSTRMASIIVTNRSTEDIETAIRTVFERHDFTEGRSDDDKLIFDKQGSFMSGMVYSDWYSGGVWERVKVYERAHADDQTVVECDGFMVKGHDDPMFSEEKRLYKTKRGHLQNLMDEVAVEVEHPTVVSTNTPPVKK